MIDAIRNRHLGKIERADPVEARDVHAVLALVGSSLMVRVYSAAGTEEVLRNASMEAVTRQSILALQQLDPARFRHDDNGAAHPAIGTVAAPDRIEAVAKRRFETHSAAMAPARPNFRVIRHPVLSPVRTEGAR